MAVSTAAAQSSQTQQANMHVRVLTYDRNMPNRGGKDAVVLAILYDTDNKASTRDAGIMHKAFTQIAQSVQLGDRKLSVIALPWSGQKMASQLRQYRAAVVYVSAGMDSYLPYIHKIASTLKTPTMAGSRSMISAGVAVGVIPYGSRVKILINRATARAHGMHLDARVFKHSELIQNP